MKKGQVGEKSGAGFYKRVGKEIHTLDWKTGEYGPQVEAGNARAHAALDAAARRAICRAARRGRIATATFVKEYLLRFSHYVLTTTPAIAYDHSGGRSRDRVGLRVGGRPVQADGPARRRLPAPRIRRARARRAGAAARGARRILLGRRTRRCCRSAAAIRTFRAKPARFVSPSFMLPANRERHVLEHSDDASLLDVGNGVAVLEFHSKMNTLGEGVIDDDASRARSRRARRTHRSRHRQRRSAHVHGGRRSLDGAQADSGGDWKKLEERRAQSFRIRRCAFGSRRFRSSPRRSVSRSAAAASSHSTPIAFRRTPSCTWGSSRSASG